MPLSFNDNYSPSRIICLTEETTELLYLLGEEDRIVGVSGFTRRPTRARKEKPTVSTFLDAKMDDILDLNPDLVIGFSDIQADMAKELIAKGVTVWVNNHRSVQEIFNMMVQLGALVDKKTEAIVIVDQIKSNIKSINSEISKWPTRPRVYFEEWYDPLISGIQWVSEIVELAGGKDIFPELGQSSLAKGRIIADQSKVIERNPDIILASWCGKMVKKNKIIERQGWDQISAIRNNDIFEIKSEIILQPGPAALIEGLPQMHEIFKKWMANNN